jgi:chemotaxis protein methyltransferase CheR
MAQARITESSGFLRTSYLNEDPSMSDREFTNLSSFIYNTWGISLAPTKKLMLSSRLRKRLAARGLDSFTQYYEFITTPRGFEELSAMISAVSTNKTDFFRDSRQFDILTDMVLPDLTERPEFRDTGVLRIWSAGCSSGEEPYTIAMTAAEFFRTRGISGRFEIHATDVSERVIAKAFEGTYAEKDIEPIPLPVRQRYLLRGTGASSGLFRITPELRETVTFDLLNLKENFRDRVGRPDIIFCRNVIIYFDRPTQRELFVKFHDTLAPGGYLFIGSSETLHGICDRYSYVTSTVYSKGVRHR